MADTSSDANTVDKQPLVPTIAPQLYAKAHDFQSCLSTKTLDLLQMSFGSKPTKSQQQFIELGCGPGDFTRLELLPRCQPCRRIVATDVSPEMVEYGKNNFAHPQIEYEAHDFESDVSGLVKKYGKFDRVYSFFALNWAKDLTAALRKVSDLMTDDGECLFLFSARVNIYRVWKRIAEMDRWRKYKKVYEGFIPPSQDIEDWPGLTSYIRGVLENANLKPRTCEVLTLVESDVDMDRCIQVVLSLDPVLPLLPEEQKAQFKTDLADVSRKFWSEKPAGDPQYSDDMFLVHASKNLKGA